MFSTLDLNPQAAPLRNAYWLLRHARCQSRATIYRSITHERKRLLVAGVDRELLRLYCLYLADPNRRNRAMRYQFERDQLALDFLTEPAEPT